ncbi:hypothetical protein ACFLUU_02580 [Chloroflexota bacterium]
MSKSTILTLADDELDKPPNCLTQNDLPNCVVSIYEWLSSWCCVTKGNDRR